MIKYTLKLNSFDGDALNKYNDSSSDESGDDSTLSLSYSSDDFSEEYVAWEHPVQPVIFSPQLVEVTPESLLDKKIKELEKLSLEQRQEEFKNLEELSALERRNTLIQSM